MKRGSKTQGDPKSADAKDSGGGASEIADEGRASRDAEDGGQVGGAAEPTFEACSERLEEIVTALEGGDLPLERSLELFEEGVRLARHAKRRLDTAERRVEELLGTDTAGQPVTKEL